MEEILNQDTAVEEEGGQIEETTEGGEESSLEEGAEAV